MLHNPTQQSLWKMHFRIEKNIFDFVCNLVRDDMRKQDIHMGGTFSVEERVGCALWRLATDVVGVVLLCLEWGKSTAIAIVKQFLKAMREHNNRFIKFPFTKEEVKQKIEEFKCLSKFPNVVGLIDGCHFQPLKKIQLTILTGNNFIA